MSLVAVLLWTIGVTALYLRCPSCLDRARQNRSCEWTGDNTTPLDLKRSADRQHLVLDAQLAEELATRYADAENLRLYGAEGHGGLIENGAVVRGCMSRMFAAIQNDHGVTADQIQSARAQRNGVYDAAVLLLFVPLYWLAAALVHRGLQRRFAAERQYVRWAATGAVSVPVALLGTQLAGLWSTLWELIRVGNDHLGGHRLATFERPSEQHAMALFLMGILLFWLVALLRREASVETVGGSPEALPRGLLLH